MRSSRWVGAVSVLCVMSTSGCYDAAGPATEAVLLIRNQRVDTIASVYVQACTDPDVTHDDSLQVRDQLLPGTERRFLLTPACYDARLADARDSIVDQRTNLLLEGRDTMIVLLLPGQSDKGSSASR